MDDLDRAILAQLRKDARTSISSIASDLKLLGQLCSTESLAWKMTEPSLATQ